MERTAVSGWVSRLLCLATVAAISGTSLVAPVRACTCPGPPRTPLALEQSDAVFLGLAVAVELLPPGTPPTWDSREIAPLGWWNNEEKLLAPSRSSRQFYERRVTFVVDAAWKGVARETMTVVTSSSGAGCGVRFELGAEYLVYTLGIEATGEHRVSSCSRTSVLFEAKEDLKELPPPAVDYAAQRYRRDGGATEVLLPELDSPSGWCGVAWCEYDSAAEPGAAGTEAAEGELSDLP